MIVLLSHSMVPLFYFLTFDGFILTLCSSNIKFNNSFVILFFSSHFTISLSHLAVPTSHLIVLLSHLMVHLFLLSHLMVPLSHQAALISHLTPLLSHSMVPFFCLKFDSSIITFGSVNITYNCTFVIFDNSLFFFPFFFLLFLHWISQ